MTTTVLGIVGCGDKKHVRSTEAKRLYTSGYFQKKRRWAEGCDTWRILSAKYGLVHPDTILEPYNTVISMLDEAETEQWAKTVVKELQPLLDDVDKVVFLAGAEYVQPILNLLSVNDVDIYWPFEGKRIGEQAQWLGNNPRPDQSTFELFD